MKDPQGSRVYTEINDALQGWADSGRWEKVRKHSEYGLSLSLSLSLSPHVVYGVSWVLCSWASTSRSQRTRTSSGHTEDRSGRSPPPTHAQPPSEVHRGPDTLATLRLYHVETAGAAFYFLILCGAGK
jgi:hypothetical protein